MFGLVHSIRRKRLFVVLLLLFLVTCGGPLSWDDIAVLKTSSGVIQAGDSVRIEPVEFAAREIKSTEFSVTGFKFSGTLLDSSADLELLPSGTMMAGKGGFRTEETQAPKPESAIQWAAGETQKAISIPFLNMPTGSAYSGKGQLYFYLTDQQKNCVSNIVAWPVSFTE